MKKRILAMLLAVVMLIGFAPVFDVTAEAATENQIVNSPNTVDFATLQAGDILQYGSKIKNSTGSQKTVSYYSDAQVGTLAGSGIKSYTISINGGTYTILQEVSHAINGSKSSEYWRVAEISGNTIKLHPYYRPTIIFDPNGGKINGSTSTVKVVGEVTTDYSFVGTIPTATHDTKGFGGWQNDMYEVIDISTKKFDTFKNSNTPHTVYAKWVEKVDPLEIGVDKTNWPEIKEGKLLNWQIDEIKLGISITGAGDRTFENSMGTKYIVDMADLTPGVEYTANTTVNTLESGHSYAVVFKVSNIGGMPGYQLPVGAVDVTGAKVLYHGRDDQIQLYVELGTVAEKPTLTIVPQDEYDFVFDMVDHGVTPYFTCETANFDGDPSISWKLILPGGDEIGLTPYDGKVGIEFGDALDAGAYKLVASAANPSGGDDITAEYTINLKVRTVTAPGRKLGSIHPQYSGQPISYEFSSEVEADKRHYNVEGNVQTNAGYYTVTVSLKDKENTKWTDGSTTDKTYTNFQIQTAPHDDLVIETPFNINSSVGSTVTINLEGLLEPGVDSVTQCYVGYDPDRDIWEDDAEDRMLFNIVDDNLHDGHYLTLEVIDDPITSDDLIYVQLTVHGATNYYTYNIDLTLKPILIPDLEVSASAASAQYFGSLNFTVDATEWKDGNGAFVNTDTVTYQVWDAAKTSMKFEGTADMIGTNGSLSKDIAVDFSEEGKQIGVGEYVFVVTAADPRGGSNPEVVDEVPFEIIKRKITVPTLATEASQEYTGSALTFGINADSDWCEVKSSDNLGTLSNGLFTVQFTNVAETAQGGKMFSVVLKDTTNTEWADETTQLKSFTFKVTKKQITIPTAVVNEFDFDGSVKNFEITTADSAYWHTTNNSTPSASNANLYYIYVELNDTNNTEWTDGTNGQKFVRFEIKSKAHDDVTVDGGEILCYENSTYSIALNGEIPADAGNVTLTPAGTDFTASYADGVLTLKVNRDTILTGNKGVVIAVSTTNYTRYNLTLNVTVVAKSVTISEQKEIVVFGDSDSTTYDVTCTNFVPSADPVITWDGGNAPAGVETVWSADHLTLTVTTTEETPANESGYGFTVTYTDEGRQFSTSGKLVVNKLVVTAPEENTAEFIFNGENQTYTPAGGNTAWFAVSNNVQRNANSYKVIVALNDGVNTVWSTGGNANIEFDFVIAPADFDITNEDQAATIRYEATSKDILANAGGELIPADISADRTATLTVNNAEYAAAYDPETGEITITRVSPLAISTSNLAPVTVTVTVDGGSTANYNDYSFDAVITPDFTVADDDEIPTVTSPSNNVLVVENKVNMAFRVTGNGFNSGWIMASGKVFEPLEAGDYSVEVCYAALLELDETEELPTYKVPEGYEDTVVTDGGTYAVEDPSDTIEVIDLSGDDIVLNPSLNEQDAYYADLTHTLKTEYAYHDGAWLKLATPNKLTVITTAPTSNSVDSVYAILGEFELTLQDVQTTGDIAVASTKPLVLVIDGDVSIGSVIAISGVTVTGQNKASLTVSEGVEANDGVYIKHYGIYAYDGDIIISNLNVVTVNAEINGICEDDCSGASAAVYTEEGNVIFENISTLALEGTCGVDTGADITFSKVKNFTVGLAEKNAEVDNVATEIGISAGGNVSFIDSYGAITVADGTDPAIITAEGIVTAISKVTVKAGETANMAKTLKLATDKTVSPAIKGIISLDEVNAEGNMYFAIKKTASDSTIEVPVSNDKTSVNVKAEVNGQDAAIESLDNNEIEQLLGDENASGNIVIDLSGLGKTIDTVEIPKSSLESIVNAAENADNKTEHLVIKLTTAKLIIDDAALRAIVDQADGDVIKFNFDDVGTNRLNDKQMKAIEGMDVRKGFEAYITVNGARISDFEGGNVEIIIPYVMPAGAKSSGFSVWYIDEEGIPEKLKSTYDGKENCFVVKHFSDYIIVYDENSVVNCLNDETCPISEFSDADASAWYHDGVHYCLDNGLMVGMPVNLFVPNGITTRAQIVTILWRMEGCPSVPIAEEFVDVPDGTWYYNAIRWASGNGIVEGYGDTLVGLFGPDDAITREQMATILWRYAKYKDYDVSVGEETNILSFEDAFDVSEYAIPAMQWACGSGLIQGIEKNDTMYLDPHGSAVRSQSATMIYRFCSEIKK